MVLLLHWVTLLLPNIWRHLLVLPYPQRHTQSDMVGIWTPQKISKYRHTLYSILVWRKWKRGFSSSPCPSFTPLWLVSPILGLLISHFLVKKFLGFLGRTSESLEELIMNGMSLWANTSFHLVFLPSPSFLVCHVLD